MKTFYVAVGLLWLIACDVQSPVSAQVSKRPVPAHRLHELDDRTIGGAQVSVFAESGHIYIMARVYQGGITVLHAHSCPCLQPSSVTEPK